MLKFRYHIAVCIILCLCGCQSQKNEEIESASISFNPTTVDSIIGKPISVHFVGEDSLLVNDIMSNPLVKIFNLKSGAEVLSAAPIGNGPGEVFPPVRIAASKDSVYIFSLTSKKLYGMPISGGEMTEITQLPLEVMGLYYLPKSGIFIAPVMALVNQEDRGTAYAYVYDKDLKKIQEIETPATLWAGEKNYPPSAISKFHQIQAICETSDGRIGILESHLIRLFDFNGNRLERIADELLFPYEYDYDSASNGSLVATTKPRSGVVKGAKDMASVGDKFLLSVDMTVNGEPVQEESVVKLLTLDKDGNPIKEYIPNVVLNPYPLAVSDRGTVVMFSAEGVPVVAKLP